MRDADTSSIERWRRRIGRGGLMIIAILFLAGLLVWLTGQQRASASLLLSLACALLVAMPVVNVVAALAEETWRRDWPFACAAAVVLLLLVYSLATALA